ncbi:MAG: ferritin family protein [Planctomycetales bacterium]|nr:ferritin family protein [Planctomycetales bacterium]
MEFKSIHELLQFALSKEEASVQFYRDLGTQVTDSMTKKLLELLAKTEEKHIQMITLEINKQGYSVPEDIEVDVSEGGFSWEERLEVDDEARKMTCREALAMGIQKERAAFRLYAQLLGLTSDERFRAMLMDLAEEEMRHVLQLEQEYESFARRGG